jgi:phage shock protein PspC (stress-responsive transcriptional regulator)
MDKTITINLTGHAQGFRLDQDGYDRLARYLDRAATRLQDDPDRAEVLGDLERSIGDRLAAVVAAGDRLLTADDIEDVLDEIGMVDTGRDHASDDGAPRRRRLVRIREGQQVAGVCTGIAAYAEINVDWVRTVVILGTIFTGGFLGLVYIALVLILPVVPRRES